MSYFAYGSNINPAVLEDLRGINPLSSVPGLVRGYKLAFNLIGLPLVSPASASAEPSTGDELHGVLFTLSRNEAVLSFDPKMQNLTEHELLILLIVKSSLWKD